MIPNILIPSQFRKPCVICMDNISAKLFRIAKLPPDEMGAALLDLAASQHKLERRREQVRKSTKKWRQNVHGEQRNVHGELFTVNTKTEQNVHGDVHGEHAYIRKKESKKERKEVSRRVSMKRSQIPWDLICSDRNIADAIKAGMSEDVIPIEWGSFVDHHLHKGTLGSDWNAGWRRWCSNHVKWNQPKLIPAKPPSPNQAAWSALYDTLDRFAENGTQGGLKLGGPTAEIISPSLPSNTRNGGSHHLAGLSVSKGGGDPEFFPRWDTPEV